MPGVPHEYQGNAEFRFPAAGPATGAAGPEITLDNSRGSGCLSGHVLAESGLTIRLPQPLTSKWCLGSDRRIGPGGQPL